MAACILQSILRRTVWPEWHGTAARIPPSSGHMHTGTRRHQWDSGQKTRVSRKGEHLEE